MTLVSDANADVFPNTSYRFTNRMCPEVYVGEDMEVAVAEISFSQIDQVENPDKSDVPTLKIFDFFVVAEPAQTGKEARYGKWYDISLKDEQFGTPEELCLFLNEKIWKHIPRVRDLGIEPFTYRADMNRIWFEYFKGTYYCVLVQGFLLRMTGLTSSDTPLRIVCLGKSKRAWGYKFDGKIRKFAANCQDRFVSLCPGKDYCKHPPLVGFQKQEEFVIYSNLVAQNIVGSELINHLRCVPVLQKNSGKRVTQTFESRFYFPTGVSFISDATIELRQLSGAFISLKGCTRVVLHFRRKGRRD